MNPIGLRRSPKFAATPANCSSVIPNASLFSSAHDLIDPVLRKSEDDPDHPDWMRLYVSWNTCGGKGTRWTSKLVNLQNWQKAMRKILRAKPGRVWVGADAAQLEYRIAAALAVTGIVILIAGDVD